MKFILKLFFIFNFIFIGLQANEISSDKIKNNLNEKEIILKTISNLENSGYLTHKNALEAKKEFVFNKKNIKSFNNILKENKNMNEIDNSEIKFSDYFSLINILKILSIILLIIAFREFIIKFLYLFVFIPISFYQLIVLGFFIFSIINPELIWKSQANYIQLFSIIFLPIIIVWIVDTHEKLLKFLENIFKLLSFNFPISVLISIYLTLYLGFFSIYTDSQFLGILTLLSFVSIFSFTIEATPLATYIGYKNDAFISSSIFINGILILFYSYCYINNITISYIDVFSIGIQYVASTAYIIGLLIYSSFYFKEEKGFYFYLSLMFISFGLSLLGSTLYHVPVIPVIINTGFIFFLLGWFGYIVYERSFILGSFLTGIFLYITALILEKYSNLFITSLF